MVLPNTLSGGAWPSSVRVVKAFLRELPLLPKGFSEKLDIKRLRQRCPVKSGNEQDPRPMLLSFLSGSEYSWGTAVDKMTANMVKRLL